MIEITVEKLATTIGTPSEKLLLQMKEAGLKQSSPSDLVTDKDKKTLLGFLKDQQSKTSKTIRLKKKSASEGSNKTTTIAIKRKTVKIQEVGTEVADDSNRIDFNEIEKKRVEGEEFKKAEEERKKQEAEKKISVKRKPIRNAEPPVVKRTKQIPTNLKVVDKKKPIQKRKAILYKKEQK